MAQDRPSWLIEWWGVTLPKRLDPYFANAADAIADGAWMAVWRRAAAYGPVIAFIVGALVPLPWPILGITWVYTEALWFMTLVTAGAILSGTVGMMLLAGYVIGDIFWATTDAGMAYRFSSKITYVILSRAADTVGYLLLALLAFRIPQLARRLANSLLVLLVAEGVALTAIRAIVYAATCAALVFLWCQGMIMLIRPVFTWVGANPDVSTVAPVQNEWRWMVGAAFVAAVARVVLQDVVATGHEKATEAIEIGTRRFNDWRKRIREAAQTPPTRVRTLVLTITTTMLLAGLYGSWVDAILVFVSIWLLSDWQAGRFGSLPAAWVRAISQIPELLRFGAVSAASYWVAEWLLAISWGGSDNFRTILFVALGTIACYALVFPRRPVSVDAGVSS